MSLSKAIAEKSIAGIVETVAEAVAIYNTAKPADENVDTVHGAIPFSAIWDEETKWNIIGAAYASIIQEVSRIPSTANKTVETAKIISQNAILRNLETSPTASADGLL